MLLHAHALYVCRPRGGIRRDVVFALLGKDARRHALYAGAGVLVLVLLVFLFPKTPVSAINLHCNAFKNFFRRRKPVTRTDLGISAF